MKFYERFLYFLQSRKKRLIVKKTPDMGRGVFALRDIEEGEIIMKDPVLLVPKDETYHAAKTIVNLYFFAWDAKHSALALGLGSLLNCNNEDYNVGYFNDSQKQKIVFVSRKKIKKGEQLMTKYGYDPKGEYDKYLSKKSEGRL